MGHPNIHNRTPFAFDALFLCNEDGAPVAAAVVKATYSIRDGSRLELAEVQAPLNAVGEFWHDEPESSYRYEPETALFKPASDVVLVGHAWAPGPRVRSVNVGFQVGPIQKALKVSGDRYWERSLGGLSMTKAEPFEKMPLTFERSFGGWDRSHADPQKHTFEPGNPVGTGFRDRKAPFEAGIRLPNLEDPRHPIRNYGDTPPPAGFGFISPHWQPRAGFAGTYDDAWEKTRKPLLPKDFDRRFFNAAPQDQIVNGYLRGDEPVVVTNASPGGRTTFRLPGIPPPICQVVLRGRRRHELRTRLDTVIVNTDDNLVFLIWRTHLALKSGPEDVVSIEIVPESIPGHANQE